MQAGASRTTSFARAALVAGLATIALLIAGTGEASATHSVFCEENVSTCPAGSQYAAETGLVATLEGASAYGEVELPGAMTMACTSGKMNGKALVQKEGPMTGEVTNFWMSGCQPETCQMSAENPKFPWEVQATGAGDGAIDISGPLITVSCAKFPWIFKCKYEAPSLPADFEGGPAVWERFIHGEETSFALVSGSGCFAKQVNLRFRYVIWVPARENKPLYLTN